MPLGYCRRIDISIYWSHIYWNYDLLWNNYFCFVTAYIFWYELALGVIAIISLSKIHFTGNKICLNANIFLSVCFTKQYYKFSTLLQISFKFNMPQSCLNTFFLKEPGKFSWGWVFMKNLSQSGFMLFLFKVFIICCIFFLCSL